MGLTTQEVKLLKTLNECGPISCNSLATILGVNECNVEEELEVRPKELGLITIQSKGRSLSKTGEKLLPQLI